MLFNRSMVLHRVRSGGPSAIEATGSVCPRMRFIKLCDVRDAIYKIVRRTGRRAGVGLVSVEDVRQSGLSLAVEGGASLRQIQVHGRLRSLAGVERYSEAKGTSGRFTESAVEFLELDT